MQFGFILGITITFLEKNRILYYIEWNNALTLFILIVKFLSLVFMPLSIEKR